MAETTKTIQFGIDDEQDAVSVQMAPLIDIVFLLICFYLLVTQLISSQVDPSIQLPTMNSPDAARELPAEIVVNLRADGSLIVGSRLMNLAQVRGVLAESVLRAAADDASIRVVIRADRRQRYGAMDEVLGVCRELGIESVILRAVGGGQ